MGNTKRSFLMALLFLALGIPAIAQTFTPINVGTTANDRTGDTLRTAFQKINGNFSSLYGTILTSNAVYWINQLASGNVSGGGTNAGVSSVNGRNGTVTLLSGDVTSALGFTPLTPQVTTNAALKTAQDATNALGSAAFKPTSFFDLAGAASGATNGLGSAAFKATSFFDLAGAAQAATNGLLSAAFHAASDFDPAGSASGATNGLGSAAFKATSFFDLAGVAQGLITATTNGGVAHLSQFINDGVSYLNGGLVAISSGHWQDGSVSGAGFRTNDASGNIDATTAAPGSWIADGTINSNKLDTATRGMLGGSGNGFPLSGTANGNQQAITNLLELRIGIVGFGQVVINSNGISYFTTNAPMSYVNDLNSNILWLVTATNRTAQLNGVLLQSNLTSQTYFYNSGTNFQTWCINTNGGGGFTTNYVYFGGGSTPYAVRFINSSGQDTLDAKTDGTLLVLGTLRADSESITNTVEYKWTPFTGPTNSIDFSHTRQSFTALTDMAITNVLNIPAAGFDRHVLLWVTNSSASDIVLRATLSGIRTDDAARSYTVTNHSVRTFQWIYNDMGPFLISRAWQ